MQIVIDIPDTVWNEAKEYGHLDICGIELSEKVMNGTPLTKGHGRLIDADAFESRCMFDSSINDMEDVIYALSCYESIIEADMESEE